MLAEGAETNFYAGDVNGFGVSPSGEEVVYTPSGGEEDGYLCIYNILEESTTVLTKPGETGMRWSQVRFAPSGDQIIGKSEGGLFSINTNGSHLRRLVNDSHAQWPVMSSDGYLAYLKEEDLYVISPVSEEGESGETKLLASHEAEAFSSRPSFQPETHIVLFPTSKSSRTFNAETGEQYSTWPSVNKRPEWETTTTLLEGEVRVQRRTLYSFSVENVGKKEGGVYWVRSNQPFGEVVPPQASEVTPDLLFEFYPYVKYDFEEPYRIIEPERLAYVYGFNEEKTKLLYVNQLKRGNRVLADPLFSYDEEAELWDYSPDGIFPFDLSFLGENYPTFAPPDIDAQADSNDYIDEHNGTYEEDAKSISYNEGEGQLQAHMVVDSTGVWLQYWMFYYYNNGIEGFADHEGDWEMMQIHLSKELGYLPDEAIFSQHNGAVRCERGEYDTEGADAPGYGGHPVVYAANGSHASYPEEGMYFTEAPPTADVVAADEEVIPTLNPGVRSLDEEGPSWVDWPGSWGSSESSPKGPKFHELQWNEPRVWADEAEECLYNKILPKKGKMGLTSARALNR